MHLRLYVIHVCSHQNCSCDLSTSLVKETHPWIQPTNPLAKQLTGLKKNALITGSSNQLQSKVNIILMLNKGH
jgi:hypothetical protein